MRKTLLLTAIFGVMLLSCQQKPAEQQPTQQQPTEQKPAEQPAQQQQQEQKPAEEPKSQAPVKDMKALAQQKGCFACHDMNVKKVGPAFVEVAKREGKKEDAVNYLANKIKNGSVGEWGSVPMPPQNVTEQEAKDLAAWILSLR